jgi:hypothetical protein
MDSLLRPELHLELHSELPLVMSLKRRPVPQSTMLVGMPSRANPEFQDELDSRLQSGLHSTLNLTVHSGQRPGTETALH